MQKDIKRIVIIGPESTGKSTLTQALAKHFRTLYVPEYARMYLEGLNRPYIEQDLINMAMIQIQIEDQLAMQVDNGLLFCDTDLYVIKVWSENKYNRCDTSILENIAERRYDLYLLTGIDMPWEDDPLREHPDPWSRSYFYHIYSDIVQNSGCPFLTINGNEEQRILTAIEGINNFLCS